jgi:hypothetical protein
MASFSRRTWLAGVPAALAVIAAPGIARARVQGDYAYAWSQVWQASVRLVRVDLQCAITDRDEEIGYVMFDYEDAGRGHPGSIELVRTTGSDGVERVRVVVQVPSMPSYIERMILDRLTRKLREDFGEPPRIARPARAPAETPAPTPPADGEEGGGTDAASASGH